MKPLSKSKNNKNTPTTSFSLSRRNHWWAAPHNAILKKRIRPAGLQNPEVFVENVGQINHKMS